VGYQLLAVGVWLFGFAGSKALQELQAPQVFSLSPLCSRFGPIHVTIAQGVGYDVTARASFGRITSQPAI
jgi:hypothetical protein